MFMRNEELLKRLNEIENEFNDWQYKSNPDKLDLWIEEVEKDIDNEDWSLDCTTEALVLAEIILQDAKGYAKKFVDKVESWRARSKETYSDMKALLIKIDQYNKDRNS